MLTSSRHLVVGGAPPIKVFTAPGATQVAIISSGGGLFIGGSSSVDQLNGFQLGERVLTFPLRNGDEIWAMTSTTAVLSILAN